MRRSGIQAGNILVPVAIQISNPSHSNREVKTGREYTNVIAESAGSVIFVPNQFISLGRDISRFFWNAGQDIEVAVAVQVSSMGESAPIIGVRNLLVLPELPAAEVGIPEQFSVVVRQSDDVRQSVVVEVGKVSGFYGVEFRQNRMPWGELPAAFVFKKISPDGQPEQIGQPVAVVIG